jgi:hypothetical protein
MKKLELVYIGNKLNAYEKYMKGTIDSERFEYGKLYKAISFNNVGIITFLDKDDVPYEMNQDILNKNFVTLSRFIKITRDKKINEILK